MYLIIPICVHIHSTYYIYNYIYITICLRLSDWRISPLPKNQLHGSQKSLGSWMFTSRDWIPNMGTKFWFPNTQQPNPAPNSLQHPIAFSSSRHFRVSNLRVSAVWAFYVRRTGSVDAEFCSHTYKATRSESPGRSVQGQQLEVPKCPKNQIQIQLVVCNML